eukprot:4772975-Amphidinium_carterae.1
MKLMYTAVNDLGNLVDESYGLPIRRRYARKHATVKHRMAGGLDLQHFSHGREVGYPACIKDWNYGSTKLSSLKLSGSNGSE